MFSEFQNYGCKKQLYHLNKKTTMMKNKITITLALAATFILSGCENFLTDNPESVLPSVDFYNTPARINQGVIGCYAGLALTTANEWMWTELRSDNTCQYATGSSNTARYNQTDINVFRIAPAITELQDYWYKIFQNISNINTVLPSVSDNSFVSNEALRGQYEGELLFMRAYHYYMLVNLFGDMFKVTTVIGPEEAKKIVRSPASEIYNDIIIPDLKKAAVEAPSTYSSADLGRITKWAAKGLLAKVYMMLGGADNLASAKLLLEEIIASGQFALQSSYANIFDIGYEMNSEILFAVRYKGGASGIGSSFWGTFAPEGSANIFLKVGTPLGYNTPTPEIIGLFGANAADKRTASCFKIWTKASNANIAYVSKYVDATMTQALQSENDWIVLRYADILLLHAEIMAQDGNYATAHNDVNKVRTRAGLASVGPFASKEEALDAVYAERRLELAFENQRWFDLLRMAKSYGDPDKPVQVLKKHVFETDWTALYSLYNPIPVPEQRFFTRERLLLPIPQYEIDTNNEMVIPQNPGY
jgi:hypothetical protein